MLRSLLALECEQTYSKIAESRLDRSKLDFFVGLKTCECFLLYCNNGLNKNFSRKLLTLERERIEELLLEFLTKKKRDNNKKFIDL